MDTEIKVFKMVYGEEFKLRYDRSIAFIDGVYRLDTDFFDTNSDIPLGTTALKFIPVRFDCLLLSSYNPVIFAFEKTTVDIPSILGSLWNFSSPKCQEDIITFTGDLSGVLHLLRQLFGWSVSVINDISNEYENLPYRSRVVLFLTSEQNWRQNHTSISNWIQKNTVFVEGNLLELISSNSAFYIPNEDPMLRNGSITPNLNKILKNVVVMKKLVNYNLIEIGSILVMNNRAFLQRIRVSTSDRSRFTVKRS
jgi:hypothetical protein